MNSILLLGPLSDCKYLGRSCVFLTFPSVVPYFSVFNTPAVMFLIRDTVWRGLTCRGGCHFHLRAVGAHCLLFTGEDYFHILVIAYFCPYFIGTLISFSMVYLGLRTEKYVCSGRFGNYIVGHHEMVSTAYNCLPSDVLFRWRALSLLPSSKKCSCSKHADSSGVLRKHMDMQRH